MEERIKVALIGGMRAGKTTIAYHIRSQDFEGLNTYSLGNGVREVADKYFEYLYEKKIVGEEPFTTTHIIKPRHVLQQVGQLMRTVDEDVWVKYVERQIESSEYFKNFRGAIIDDIRQPNEYEWAKRNGFVIVKIDTPIETRIERMLNNGEEVDEALFNHETEQHYDSFEYDHLIDGTMSEKEIINFIEAAYNEGKFKGKTKGWEFIA